MSKLKSAAGRAYPAQKGRMLLSRRVAIAAGVATPLAGHAADTSSAPGSPLRGADGRVAQLVQRAEQANSAFMRGDMDRWYRLAGPISDDFTLMQPFGGHPSRGFDGSSAHLQQLSRYFQNGTAVLELVESYASADLVVLVMIERQHGEVGGLPDQDWSLRVTQVYRRRGEQWELVHRHADPLVRNIGLERTAALAR